MHRRGARKENQDAAIFGRNRTPCAGRWLSRATSPVLHYLRRNGDKICLPNSKIGPWVRTPAAQPGPRPSPARDPPSLGPAAPCPPHHLALRRAPEARKCAACCRLQTERRFRMRPLRCSAHNAQLGPGRCRHPPPAGLTFAEQRQQQEPSQPRGAGRRLRHRPCAPGPRQEG